ncbi:MAG TPA: choice-of-anchor Q domain-containing protein [Rudaea sp.]|nr:choice-of-anchor Q domain-containing protein [Rudaea sp.]
MPIPFRHHAFHLAVCAALSLVAEHVIAAPLSVTNCYDDGSSGSLRTVIGGAASGDTVELSGLSSSDPGCAESTITLSDGQIAVGGIDLTIVGPGANKLSIVGTGNKPMFNGTSASGKLTFEDITVAGGTNTTSHLGGCIYSMGEVDLDAATVSGCNLSATVSGKYGGLLSGAGLYAHVVRLSNGSLVSGNTDTIGGGLIYTFGGGVGAYDLYCNDSTVSGNYATHGGGGMTAHVATIQGCTISGNSTAFFGGGLIGWTGSNFTVNESTISGNTSKQIGGGVYAAGALTINNSTVAFNYSKEGGAGIETQSGFTLRSTIVAQNSDSYGTNIDVGVNHSGEIAGSYNLIMNSGTAQTMPNTIISSANPHLVPLGNHGGLTRTHALLSDSPAIDTGSNLLKATTDQRGTGFARDVPAGSPDIGAYERQAVDDEIFYDGFDDT